MEFRLATNIVLSVVFLVVLTGAMSAVSANERKDTRNLYELTVNSARALESSPFDRPANQRLRAALTAKIDAFSFDIEGNYKGVLFNCEYAARQLVVILDDAILSERPVALAEVKLMLERAMDWETEMEGCRRFLNALPTKVDMRAVARRVAGN